VVEIRVTISEFSFHVLIVWLFFDYLLINLPCSLILTAAHQHFANQIQEEQIICRFCQLQEVTLIFRKQFWVALKV